MGQSARFMRSRACFKHLIVLIGVPGQGIGMVYNRARSRLIGVLRERNVRVVPNAEVQVSKGHSKANPSNAGQSEQGNISGLDLFVRRKEILEGLDKPPEQKTEKFNHDEHLSVCPI